MKTLQIFRNGIETQIINLDEIASVEKDAQSKRVMCNGIGLPFGTIAETNECYAYIVAVMLGETSVTKESYDFKYLDDFEAVKQQAETDATAGLKYYSEEDNTMYTNKEVIGKVLDGGVSNTLNQFTFCASVADADLTLAQDGDLFFPNLEAKFYEVQTTDDVKELVLASVSEDELYQDLDGDVFTYIGEELKRTDIKVVETKPSIEDVQDMQLYEQIFVTAESKLYTVDNGEFLYPIADDEIKSDKLWLDGLTSEYYIFNRTMKEDDTIDDTDIANGHLIVKLS